TFERTTAPLANGHPTPIACRKVVRSLRINAITPTSVQNAIDRIPDVAVQVSVRTEFEAMSEQLAGCHAQSMGVRSARSLRATRERVRASLADIGIQLK